MSPSNPLLTKIGPESEPVLRDLFKHYLAEMAEWFEIESDAGGSYSYDFSSIWKNGYDTYLAKAGEAIAGFAIIGSAAEWLEDPAAHDVHEFFVLREFRRSGLGQRMATLLWSERPREWLVRVLEANTPALLFWRAAISTYTRGSFDERTRIINGRPWRFFRFVSNPPGNG
jgi:predicted acetyltransferase